MPKLFTLKPEFKDPPPATQPQNFKSNQHTPHKKRICRSFRPDPSPERRRWLKEWGPGGAFTPSMLKCRPGSGIRASTSPGDLSPDPSLSLSHTHIEWVEGRKRLQWWCRRRGGCWRGGWLSVSVKVKGLEREGGLRDGTVHPIVANQNINVLLMCTVVKH